MPFFRTRTSSFSAPKSVALYQRPRPAHRSCPFPSGFSGYPEFHRHYGARFHGTRYHTQFCISLNRTAFWRYSSAERNRPGPFAVPPGFFPGSRRRSDRQIPEPALEYRRLIAVLRHGNSFFSLENLLIADIEREGEFIDLVSRVVDVKFPGDLIARGIQHRRQTVA